MGAVAGPSIRVLRHGDEGLVVLLEGRWTLSRLKPLIRRLSEELERHAALSGVTWDCRGIEVLDSAGALMLWRAWRHQVPERLEISDEHRHIIERIDRGQRNRPSVRGSSRHHGPLQAAGLLLLDFVDHLADFMVMIGTLVLDGMHVIRRPADLPRREIFANLYKSGVRAMPVTALVGFLIGIVLSYLSALQLKQFGGEIFIVNILGMGIIRELGPVLVAVLVAGRSGSAMTAQLGVMRVTEEIDALATMGVSRSLRLILPKVVALAIAMPLLVLWLSSVALIGGMIAAQLQLDISYGYFIEVLPKVVPLANLWIGLTKGVLFGIMVAFVACHFGLRVKPNTESLSANTTSSVVTAITVVILVDAIVAILTRSIGLV
ncbi:MAG: ABC transporter permease [Sterolibacterium sp.]|jgi:phospholipid/cholesterol/gamma-HCH transport system permease protein|nr:ABC transporter permease [Sterolibacterium sp.]MBP9799021.1 ABC transporter permease [Sterolibacterium sp.]